MYEEVAEHNKGWTNDKIKKERNSSSGGSSNKKKMLNLREVKIQFIFLEYFKAVIQNLTALTPRVNHQFSIVLEQIRCFL